MRPFLMLLTVICSIAAAQPEPEPMYQGKKAAAWVDTLLSDPSARQRALAATALGKIWGEFKYEPGLEALGRAVRLDTSAAVRVQALTVIAGLEADIVKRPLGADKRSLTDDLVVAASTEKDERVRKTLASTIALFPEASKRSVESMTGYLKDADPTTRIAAATSLGRTGSNAKSALAALLPLLRDADAGVRRAAVFAIARVAPDDVAAGTALAELLITEKELAVRQELLHSLGLCTERSGIMVQAVSRILSDPDQELRRLAVLTLGRFGPAASTVADEILKIAKTDKSKQLRVEAIRTFSAAVGPEGLKKRLSDLFAIMDEDPDFEVRLTVVGEIGALGNSLKGDTETLAALKRRLNDPSARVRTAAADAIKRIETPASSPDKKP